MVCSTCELHNVKINLSYRVHVVYILTLVCVCVSNHTHTHSVFDPPPSALTPTFMFYILRRSYGNLVF